MCTIVQIYAYIYFSQAIIGLPGTYFIHKVDPENTIILNSSEEDPGITKGENKILILLNSTVKSRQSEQLMIN